MAVDFATAPTFIPPSSKYHPSNAYQQSTPISSANATPTNISPTSPRNSSAGSSSTALYPSSFQQRQLKPPKSPLYVPAVLRPTERPSRYNTTNATRYGFANHSRTNSSFSAKIGGPLTPPPSAKGSFDEHGNLDGKMVERRILEDAALASGVTRIVTDEWNDEMQETATGPPTRDHWKLDAMSTTCDATEPSGTPCPITFSILNRRHHCRRCGLIFCALHSQWSVALDQHARFHFQGFMSRACGSCRNDYVAWKRTMKRRNSDGASIGKGSVAGSSGTATPLPCGRQAKEAEGQEGEKAGNGKEVAVGSVSRDWNWSTF